MTEGKILVTKRTTLVEDLSDQREDLGDQSEGLGEQLTIHWLSYDWAKSPAARRGLNGPIGSFKPSCAKKAQS